MSLLSYMANPLINGDSGYELTGFTATNSRRQPDAGGSPPVGTGSLSGSHNTPLHCSALVLIALAVVFGLYWSGFRFAFDVGMGRS